MRVILPAALRGQLAATARAAFPHECCGLIEGANEGDVIRALALHPIANRAEAPTSSFLIDPSAHIALQRSLRGTGRDIVGCYHSHPNGRPEPSARDRKSGGTGGFIWLIAAFSDEELSLGAFDGSDFSPVDLSA